MIELRVPASELRVRIAARTRAMFASGLVEETRAILERGDGTALRELAAIGYDECLQMLAGRIDQTQAESEINRRTAQLAKRQRTWFRNQVAATVLDGEGGSEAELLAQALAASV